MDFDTERKQIKNERQFIFHLKLYTKRKLQNTFITVHVRHDVVLL